MEDEKGEWRSREVKEAETSEYKVKDEVMEELTKRYLGWKES